MLIFVDASRVVLIGDRLPEFVAQVHFPQDVLDRELGRREYGKIVRRWLL